MHHARVLLITGRVPSCNVTPDMEVYAFSKEQQGVFCEGEVRIALPRRQLLVDAAQAAIHCLHSTAELLQPLILQLLLLLL